MLEVYRVLPDWDAYQSFRTEESMLKWLFDGTPIAGNWRAPAVYVPFPRYKKGAFWGCFLRNSVFAVTPESRGAIETFVYQSAEQLPLQHEGRAYAIVNVTSVVNCLDTKKSDYDPELPHMIDNYVFRPKRFEWSLFKIPETRMSEVLCVEGIADPEDEFKGAVEKYKLKGLRFESLWSEKEK